MAGMEDVRAEVERELKVCFAMVSYHRKSHPCPALLRYISPTAYVISAAL